MATFDASINTSDASISIIAINNLGLTCYLNSALQFVLSISEIINSLITIDVSIPPTNKIDAIAYELIKGLKCLNRVKYQSTKESKNIRLIWEPRNLLKTFIEYKPDFTFNEQHDASEMVTILFDILEYSSYTKVIWKESIVQNISYKQFQHCVCSGCGNDSVSINNCTFIGLNLPEDETTQVDIAQLITEASCSKEIIDSYACDICKNSKNKCTKFYTCEKPGKYVILLLTRFTNDLKKKKNKVNFSGDVEFAGKYYRPKSIITHHGSSSTSGHYTTSIFPKYIIDDESVQEFENFSQIYSKTNSYIYLLSEV
jgi:uncharacterized UBP type Zn finger protein